MTTTTHPLHKTSDLPRTHVLDAEVDVAHIDPQFKGRRTDEALQPAVLNTLFSQYPSGLRQGAVVNAHGKIHVPDLEAACQDLGDGTSVRKQEDRLVSFDEVSYYPKPRRDLGMGIQARGKGVVLLAWRGINDLESHESGDGNTDDLEGPLSSDEEFRDFLWASDRGGEADDLKIPLSDEA